MEFSFGNSYLYNLYNSLVFLSQGSTNCWTIFVDRQKGLSGSLIRFLQQPILLFVFCHFLLLYPSTFLTYQTHFEYHFEFWRVQFARFFFQFRQLKMFVMLESVMRTNSPNRLMRVSISACSLILADKIFRLLLRLWTPLSYSSRWI